MANFITAHDGFTLADVLRHRRKHKEANGEGNRVRRAMMTTLLLAQGTPLLRAGDEIGNSQGGNNNACCQDNPTGWHDRCAGAFGFRITANEAQTTNVACQTELQIPAHALVVLRQTQ